MQTTKFLHSISASTLIVSVGIPVAVIGVVMLLISIQYDWSALTPYLPDKSTMWTLLTVAALTAGLWIIYRNASSATNNTQMSNSVITFTGLAGLSIAACSLGLSVVYGFVVGGQHPFLPYVYAVIFGAISIAEFVGSYWLNHYMTQRNALMFMVACVAFVLGIGNSILAGQALIATEIEQYKVQKMQNSDAYKSHLAQIENANNKASDLAINATTANDAQDRINALLSTARGMIVSNAAYSDCSNFPVSLCNKKGDFKSRTNDLNAALMPIQQEIAQYQQVITQYNEYQGALSYANELQSKPVPKAEINGELAHVVWLSKLTGIEPATIEARMYIALSVIAELIGLIMLYFYGQATRQADSEQVKIANVTLNSVPAMNVGGLVHSDGLAYLHAGERVLTAQQTADYDLQHVLNSMPDGKHGVLNSMPDGKHGVLNSMPKRTKKNGTGRTKGTADTDTKGAFNGRYVHYLELVQNGLLNPSVHAFRKVDFNGKKLGTTTAQEFLNAMVSEGLLMRGNDSQGRNIYKLK